MYWVAYAVILAIIVILVLASSISTNVASAQQAQAAIEAARVAQMATAGQTAVNIGLVIVVLVLVLLVLGLVILIIRYDLRRRHPDTEIVVSNPVDGKWKAGPNAQWQRNRELPGPGVQLSGDPLQQLVQLQMLKMLQEMNRTSQDQVSLAAPKKQVKPDEDDFPVTW